MNIPLNDFKKENHIQEIELKNVVGGRGQKFTTDITVPMCAILESNEVNAE